MLGILILRKNIQKELEKLIKNLLSILLIKKKLQKKINSLSVILIMMKLSFCSRKDFSKIEVKNNISINVFSYENGLGFPIYVSDQKFKDSMDLLLLIDDDISHYVCIKDFDIFMFHKTKNKNKKHFCKSCLQCFSSENVLTEHKEDCLSINGKQSVKVEEETIEF